MGLLSELWFYEYQMNVRESFRHLLHLSLSIDALI